MSEFYVSVINNNSYKKVCMCSSSSLDLFESVSEDLRREIADEGRVLSFLSDKVIDSDSSDSQFIYFITKVGEVQSGPSTYNGHHPL